MSKNPYSSPQEAWIPSEGYVLRLNRKGMETLEGDLTITGVCSKAIPKVPAALRRRNMLCFISAEPGKLTHVARSKVYYPAESGRDKLDIWSMTELPKPIGLAALAKRLEGPQAWRARKALQGAHLSASAFAALMKALKSMDEEAHDAAIALIDAPREAEEGELPNARVNWAFQRDAVVTVMEIAGVPRGWLKVPSTAPGVLPPDATSIFDSDEDTVSIEDTIILQDSDAVDDEWTLLKRQRYPAKTYENNGTKLTVILANKLDLEKQLGVDLIYVNETYGSVVFVQYKMFRGAEGEQGYRPDPQLAVEIARMDAAATELAKIGPDESCDGYRLGHDPFFLKFCTKLVPASETGHVPGVYVPLSYWKRLAADPRAEGKRKGIVVFDDTFGRRRMTSTLFTDMVGRGWIGTTGLQSGALLSYLKSALQGRKGVVFAVQSALPAEEDEESDQDEGGDGSARPTSGGVRRRKNRYPGRKVPPKVWLA